MTVTGAYNKRKEAVIRGEVIREKRLYDERRGYKSRETVMEEEERGCKRDEQEQ